MRVGTVVQQTFDLYQRFFLRLVGTAAIVYVVLDFVGALLGSLQHGNILGLLFWGLVTAALSLVGFFWLTGALVEAVSDVRDGRAEVPIGELFSRTSPRLPALIASGVLAAIGIAFGLLLLIVPGLYLLTRWALIAPVIVLERRAAGEAFSRSADLVRGHGWSVFGVLVITMVLSWIASAIVGGVLRSILPDFLGLWLGALAAHALVAPFVATAITVVYFELTRPAPAEAEPLPA